jgi:multiple sugar transport system permease protein
MAQTLPTPNTAPRSFATRRFSSRTLALWLLLLPVVIVLAAPVWYMIAKAFTPEVNQYRFPIVWSPDPFTLRNFEIIFSDRALPIFRWMLNSVVVTTVGTVMVLLVSALSAYAFARLQFPGRDAIFATLVISMMVPSVLQVIPTFLLMRDLGKFWSDLGLDQNPITSSPMLKLGLDGYPALWLTGIAGAGTIFFLRQQFFGIPRELEDAAVVDGAGRFRIFWQVCLPLVKTAIVASGIGIALGFWNELFWALIMLSSRESITLPVGLLVLTQSGYVQRGLAFSGGFIATVPPIIVYALFQRQIVQGMTTAGMAGR